MKKYARTAHWEYARDMRAAVAYCKKEETRVEGPWEFGEAVLAKEKLIAADYLKFTNDEAL